MSVQFYLSFMLSKGYISSIDRPSHALTPSNCQLLTDQAPKRTKKLPVTRKDDFLWGI